MHTRNTLFSFKFKSKNAKNVFLAGNFNNWDKKADQMKKVSGDSWELKKKLLLPGKYLYKFVINGLFWQHDPSNPEKEDDGRGGYNSVLISEHRDNTLNNLLKKRRQLRAAGTGHSDQKRSEILISLDDIFLLPGAEHSRSIEDFFYSSITEIERSVRCLKGHKDIKIWQAYNSGIIIGSHGLFIGIDVVTGRGIYGLNWNGSDKLAERLAEMLDILIITHSHSDHMDTGLMKNMIKKRKSLVIPESKKIRTGAGILTAKPLYQVSFRGIRIIPYRGRHVYDTSGRITNFYYEIIFPYDISLLHTGDHDYCLGIKTLKRPNILVPKCCGISDKIDDKKAMDMLTSRLLPDIVIPVHLIELGHPTGGGRFGFRDAYNTVSKSNFTPLLWGESLTVKDVHP